MMSYTTSENSTNSRIVETFSELVTNILYHKDDSVPSGDTPVSDIAAKLLCEMTDAASDDTAYTMGWRVSRAFSRNRILLYEHAIRSGNAVLIGSLSHSNGPYEDERPDGDGSIAYGIMVSKCNRQKVYENLLVVGDNPYNNAEPDILCGLAGSMFDPALIPDKLRYLLDLGPQPRFREYTAYMFLSQWAKEFDSGPKSFLSHRTLPDVAVLHRVMAAAGKWFLSEYGHMVSGARGKPWRSVRRMCGDHRWAARNILGHIEGLGKPKSTPGGSCPVWDKRFGFKAPVGRAAPSWDNMLHWSLRAVCAYGDAEDLCYHGMKCIVERGSVPADSALYILASGVSDASLTAECHKSIEAEAKLLDRADPSSAVALRGFMRSLEDPVDAAAVSKFIWARDEAISMGRRSEKTVSVEVASEMMCGLHNVAGATEAQIRSAVAGALKSDASGETAVRCAYVLRSHDITLGSVEGFDGISEKTMAEAFKVAEPESRIDLLRLFDMSTAGHLAAYVIAAKDVMSESRPTVNGSYETWKLRNRGVSAAAVELGSWIAQHSNTRSTLVVSFVNHNDTMERSVNDLILLCESLEPEN